MTSSNSRRTVFALACAATLSLVAAPAPVVASPEDPQTNKEWDEYYRGPGIFREMPALYYTSDFTEVFNAIVPIGKGETCQSAVEGSVDGGPFAGMLAQLNKLRKESPELLEGMSYGPVHIDSEPPWLDAGHFGVVIYPTPGPGETWEDTIHRGVVIEQTNYISDVTGKYLLRNWDDWENPTFLGRPIGHGGVFTTTDTVENAPYYWDEDETYPDPPEECDPQKERCDEGGGGGGGGASQDPLNAQDDHAAPAHEESLDVGARASLDPNEKIGSVGVGTERYVSGKGPLTYEVSFENVGSAPAQVVTIEDRLDVANLDLSSLSLGPISFGDTEVAVPLGATDHEVLLDLRPDRDLLLRIRANLDVSGGVVTWVFESIDPATWELPVFDGFLPPNDVPPEGQGTVSYSVTPLAGLASETAIGTGRTADIVFDDNAPIETADWVNTIDNAAPESHVETLGPLQATSRFEVTWTGTDPSSSGIRDYEVWVAEDGGGWRPWLIGRPEESAFLTGRAGRTYSFFSMARDRVGNQEAEPPGADATTTTAVLDHFLAYQAGEADRRADALPKDCNVTLDDALFDGAQNYTVSGTARFLVPADKNDEGIVDGVTHLLAYRIKGAREGVEPPTGKCSKDSTLPRAPCIDDAECTGGVCENRKFPKTAKHARRSALLVENQFGRVFLDTIKEKYLLLPTPKGLGAPPNPVLGPSAVDHYACYAARTSKRLVSDQAPGGKFRKDLQVLVEDQFANGRIRLCAAGAPKKAGEICKNERSCGGEDGVTGFCQSEPHPVLGTAKVYDLKKPALFCNPVEKYDVDTTETDDAGRTRTTSCNVVPATVGSPSSSLVCYLAKEARKITDPLVAARVGVAPGTRIEPKQGSHEARTPFVLTQLPNPQRIETKKEFELCVPSETLWVPQGS